MTKKNYLYSTYNYGDLETSADDDGNTEKEFGYTDEFGDWVFCYFGYSFVTKEAYSYIKFRRREDSFLFTRTFHFVPTYFHMYLGNDGLYPQFEG